MLNDALAQSPASLAHPDAAVAAVCALVQPVKTEKVHWSQAAGRVLAEPVLLDRPSPACDVSAMDGYALRMDDTGRGALPVYGEVQAGMMAEPIRPGHAVRIFTGAMVPPGADAVIPRELLIEHPDRIELPADLHVETRQHIRQRGENGAPGRLVADRGRVITPPLLAAIASCGMSQVQVHRRVRVGVIITGGEVCRVEDHPAPWQLRDGNGAALMSLLAGIAWLESIQPRYVADHPELIAQAIQTTMKECDALLLTGGVSAGDYDHVPPVLRSLGMSIVFHKLAIRPGKPVLGAVDPAGRPIFGLPGNPVSAMVTARRLAADAIRARAGISPSPTAEIVDVADTDHAPAKLTWFPLARLTSPGRASLIPGMGSGDWVSAAGSDGFLEVPPNTPASGPRRFYRWSIAS